MGTWGTKPWQDDIAADWFGNMMDSTGLAKYVEKTMRQELDEDDPYSTASEIRAAASVLVLLGHVCVWTEDLENHLKLAISRLEEILPKNYSNRNKEQIQAEINVLKARLDDKTDRRMEKVKWWHFDE